MISQGPAWKVTIYSDFETPSECLVSDVFSNLFWISGVEDERRLLAFYALVNKWAFAKKNNQMWRKLNIWRNSSPFNLFMQACVSFLQNLITWVIWYKILDGNEIGDTTCNEWKQKRFPCCRLEKVQWPFFSRMYSESVSTHHWRHIALKRSNLPLYL